MIIASTLPEYRASVIIKPVEESMRINHYKKESVWSRGACQFLAAAWFLILAGYVISLIWK